MKHFHVFDIVSKLEMGKCGPKMEHILSFDFWPEMGHAQQPRSEGLTSLFHFSKVHILSLARAVM